MNINNYVKNNRIYLVKYGKEKEGYVMASVYQDLGLCQKPDEKTLIINKDGEIVYESKQKFNLYDNNGFLEIKKIPTNTRKCGYIPYLCFGKINDNKVEIVNRYKDARYSYANKENVLVKLTDGSDDIKVKGMFLYNVCSSMPSTPVFDDITEFTYSDCLEKKVALATKVIGEYKILVYIDTFGNYVSNIYNFFTNEFINISNPNFSFNRYIKSLRELIELSNINVGKQKKKVSNYKKRK